MSNGKDSPGWLRNHLDCNLLLCYLVDAKLHLAEMACAQSLADVILGGDLARDCVSDHLLIPHREEGPAAIVNAAGTARGWVLEAVPGAAVGGEAPQPAKELRYRLDASSDADFACGRGREGRGGQILYLYINIINV